MEGHKLYAYNAKTRLQQAGLRPSKNQFFDGTTVLCLSSFGLPGGKEQQKSRPFRAIRSTGQTGAAGKTG